MAQHDYNIANDTAANVRADINNVLEAIVSNNSDASAPSTTYANQWWYDSDNDILKIRNESDTAWINVLSIDQVGGTVTPYLGDSVDTVPIGVGQTWQDVTGSRGTNTSYQNTTGRPIEVAIFGLANNATGIQVSDDNSTWVDVGVFPGNGTRQSVNFTVPDDHYYRVSGSGITLSRWAELR